jgi:hypothetical protein
MFQKPGLGILLARIDIVPDKDNHLRAWGVELSIQKGLAENPAMLLVLHVNDIGLELPESEVATLENPTC